MDLIRNLERVRAGIVEPKTMIRMEAARRASNMRLSEHRDVERVHTGGVNTLDIDPTEGKYLLSGCSDGTIYIHQLHNVTGVPNYTSLAVCEVDRENAYSHKYSIECVKWYPFDTGMFVTSGMDKHLKIWDTNTMKPVDVFPFEFRIFRHDIADNCLIAVVSSSKQVHLVDLRSGSCTHELRGHSDSVFTCKWSAHQESLLATGGRDNRAILWDVRSAKNCLLSLDQHNRQPQNNLATAHDGSINSLTFTDDGLFLLTFGTDNKLKLWSTLTGLKEMVNYGRVPNDFKNKQIDVTVGTTPSLVFVPTTDIHVFQVHTGTKVNKLVGHIKSVNSCAYHHQYQELYSGANDRNVLVWTSNEFKVRLDDTKEDYFTRFVFGQSSTELRKLTADNWSSDEDID